MSEIFPPELTDRIIGCVDITDKETLCNCALVCHNWLPASRHALFRRVDIPDGTTLELLTSRVLLSDSARPYLARVRELHVGRCVHHPFAEFLERQRKKIYT
ncbi:hypothetical protein C8T65DRAFT_587900 [Cerioporus squamosus]|nr:hypothetical protein C8T65DRAFT_587900 [Cerioporus squamosus]